MAQKGHQVEPNTHIGRNKTPINCFFHDYHGYSGIARGHMLTAKMVAELPRMAAMLQLTG